MVSPQARSEAESRVALFTVGKATTCFRAKKNGRGMFMQVLNIIWHYSTISIAILVRNPEDPAMQNYYERFVAGFNEDIKGRMAGYLSPNPMATTTVGGFRGFETDRRWVFNGSTDESPTPDRRLPRPAIIGWYDTDTWAQYVVEAPLGVPLSELRLVVDSMYESR